MHSNACADGKFENNFPSRRIAFLVVALPQQYESASYGGGLSIDADSISALMSPEKITRRFNHKSLISRLLSSRA